MNKNKVLFIEPPRLIKNMRKILILLVLFIALSFLFNNSASEIIRTIFFVLLFILLGTFGLIGVFTRKFYWKNSRLIEGIGAIILGFIYMALGYSFALLIGTYLFSILSL